MTIKYEMMRFRFEHDPALERLIRELASPGTLPIQGIIDACALQGFDGRATATEIGILMMDGELRSSVPTDRLGGSTIVEPTRV